MLFITARTPNEKPTSTLEIGRALTFDKQNTDVSVHEYFCKRNKKDHYIEIGSQSFFKELKELDEETQLLFYIHGFNNLPEADVFPRTEKLEARLNAVYSNKLVKVIPIIWPCDDDSPIAFVDDYWDDQRASKIAGMLYSRLLGKFEAWRNKPEQLSVPCLKRINILAHSMGNNVLQHAIAEYAESHGRAMPQLFRNIFMVAGDVENQTLEKGETGQFIPESARNVVAYYANDDLAMPASKVANLKNLTISRRLGMTGIECLEKTPKNVIEVDCDNFNNTFDLPKGHSYFIETNDGKTVSPCIAHMAHAIKTGRVQHTNRQHVLF